MGRAERDLPEDETEGLQDGSGPVHEGEGFALLTETDPSSFVAGASGLAGGAEGSAVYVLNPGASGEELLRAFDPSAGSGATFDIPAAAVESVKPLGVYGAGGGLFLASIRFRPGFESLAETFRRLIDGAGDGAIRRGGDGAEAFLDEDPAAPQTVAESATTDMETARALANGGREEDVADADVLDRAARAANRDFPFPTMPLDIDLAKAFLNACMTSSPRVTYGLGAKVPFFGAVPGKDFKKVDCSGFVREAIRRATSPRVDFPDGSVVQHDWIREHGFKKSTVDAGSLKDGAVRIAFLRPQDVSSHIGHVVLIHNGRTLESHGGVGPNSRAWTQTGWQAKAFVYVLTAPTG
jgi:hypothetical protein